MAVPRALETRFLVISTMFALIALVVVAVDDSQLQRFSRTEIHMAVDFEVVLYAADEKKANEAIDKAMARIAALDKALSDYDSDSELSKLSESSGRPVGAPAG